MASACLLALLLLLLGAFPAVPAESVGILRDILGRGGGGGGGASFVPRDPGFRMEWGTLRAAPPLSGRRSEENLVGKVSSGVSGRLEEFQHASCAPRLLLCAPVLASALPRGSGVRRD